VTTRRPFCPATAAALSSNVRIDTVVASTSLRTRDAHAQDLRPDYVGSEHILLGLLREQLGLAARVLELAKREVLSLGQDYVGTEHILLGLLRETECVAARILVDYDVDFEATRAELIAGSLRVEPCADRGDKCNSVRSSRNYRPNRGRHRRPTDATRGRSADAASHRTPRARSDRNIAAGDSGVDLPDCWRADSLTGWGGVMARCLTVRSEIGRASMARFI
jgi:hypothetical protein